MSKEDKIKILVLGPVSTGKTSICNYLGDTGENASGDNRPTKGVRIVEFMADGLSSTNKNPRRVEVELWDCSGDPIYEQCWPALRNDVDGVAFVYSRDTNHEKQILQHMYNFFVESCGFPDKRCIVLYNSHGGRKRDENPLPGVNHAVIDLANLDHEVRKTFNSFIKTILK